MYTKESDISKNGRYTNIRILYKVVLKRTQRAFEVILKVHKCNTKGHSNKIMVPFYDSKCKRNRKRKRRK